MGRKRKSDGGGLGAHVVALRAGRTTFTPEVRQLFSRFLLMLNRRYNSAAAAAAGRHDEVNSAIKEGIRRRYGQLADAAMVFLEDLSCPWSRQAWHQSDADLELWAASVLADSAGGPCTDPPAGREPPKGG